LAGVQPVQKTSLILQNHLVLSQMLEKKKVHQLHWLDQFHSTGQNQKWLTIHQES
jgi:hypothetical protein